MSEFYERIGAPQICTPVRIHICALVKEIPDNDFAPSCACGMDWQDAVEDGVYGLSLAEGELDEPEIARGCREMEVMTCI